MTTCLRRASLATALALASGAFSLLAQSTVSAVHLETGGKGTIGHLPHAIELVVFPPVNPQEGRLASSSWAPRTDRARSTRRTSSGRARGAPSPARARPASLGGKGPHRLRGQPRGTVERAHPSPPEGPEAGRIRNGGGDPAPGRHRRGCHRRRRDIAHPHPDPRAEKLNVQLDLQGAATRNGWAIAPT